ncbi:MAG: beta-1,3-glucanase family protein [Candidatus Aureabacteria bacterium]|nr:beta-1,3-glucanase family protein [Candidatus Auribacterota bacterium]
MKKIVLHLPAILIFVAFTSTIYASDLLKVTVANNSDQYGDDQVYVQMLGLDPGGSGKNGYVDLATSTWREISEADNTVTPPGGPWGKLFTNYSKKLSELASEGSHAGSFNMPRIISGRIYVSFEQPVYFHVNPGPALETPSAVDASLPNYSIIFDKVELDWENGKYPFLNTTTVDFFSISFMLELQLANGTSQKRGFTQTRKTIMNNLTTLPAIWQNGVVTSGSSVVRFNAPQIIPDPNPFANYFDSYVTDCWNYYTPPNTLTLQNPPNTAAWSATGQVIGGDFTFVTNTGETVTINNLVGQSTHIFGCDGAGYLFTTGSDSIAKQGIITQMGAALNRTVLFNIKDSTTWWNDPAQFYAQDITNHYSKVLHAAAYEGYCYGFPYDDVGNFSTGVTGDAIGAVITIQSMTSQTPPSPTPLPIVNLKPNKYILSKNEQLTVLLDVTQPITTSFYPGFYFQMPNGKRLYITQGNKLTATPSAYIQKKQGKKSVPVAIRVPRAISNYQLFKAPLKSVPVGAYMLQGGALNTKPVVVNGQYNWLSNGADTERLQVR